MTRQDLIIGTIRTAVPGAITIALVQLVTLFPPLSDVIVSVDEVLAVSAPGFTVVILLNAAVFGLVLGAYYWVVRKVGARFPVVERWLLGSAKTPTYDALTPTEIEADVQAAVYQGRHEA